MKCAHCREPLAERISTYESPYHYTESGLEGVFLINVLVHYCAHCPNSEGAIISKPRALHFLLAKEILMRPTPMSGEELRFLRAEAGMRPKDLADVLGVDPKTITNWEAAAQLSRQNDLTVRFLIANKLQGRGSVDINIGEIASADWEQQALQSQIEASFIAVTLKGWEIGPPEDLS